MARTLIMSKKIRKVVKAVISVQVHRPKTNDYSMVQAQPMPIPTIICMSQLALRRRREMSQVCRNLPLSENVAHIVHFFRQSSRGSQAGQTVASFLGSQAKVKGEAECQYGPCTGQEDRILASNAIPSSSIFSAVRDQHLSCRVRSSSRAPRHRFFLFSLGKGLHMKPLQAVRVFGEKLGTRHYTCVSARLLER